MLLLREIDEWLTPYRAAWRDRLDALERHLDDGEMLVFDPPSVMELTWGADRLRIEVQPSGTGTLLTLTDTFGELGKAARDAAGWHECLDRLACELEGRTPPGWGETWRQAHPVYVERFGPDAATIGPPGREEETTQSPG